MDSNTIEIMSKLKKRFNINNDEIIIKACLGIIYFNTSKENSKLMKPEVNFMREHLTMEMDVYKNLES